MTTTETAITTEANTPSETAICPVSTYQPNYARNASVAGEDDKNNKTLSIRNKKNIIGDCDVYSNYVDLTCCPYSSQSPPFDDIYGEGGGV